MDYVIILVLAGLCLLAIRTVRKQKQQGCCGTCAGCPKAAGCSMDEKEKNDSRD